MADDSPLPIVAPEEAIAFFRAKGLAASFSWLDVWQAEHAKAFTVAKAMNRDVLEAIREALDSALAEGTTLDQFRDTLRPRLEALGWWGRKRMTDPLTGESQIAQLGSPRRLKIIFNTNMRTAYAVGRWERIQRTKKAFPILVYKSKMDGRERPEHRDWHNTALSVDDPWWDTHYPPCDWECRCQAVPMTRGQAERRGFLGDLSRRQGDAVARLNPPPTNPMRQYVNKRTGEVMMIERGIGAGWNYHVGRSPLDGLAPRPMRGFGLDEGNALASVMPAAPKWFAAFGLKEAGQFIDATGWPLAISQAWLNGLSFGDQDRAVELARAIADPDSIRLVWVTGKDGRAMLVRRYIRNAPDVMASPAVDVVDVGGPMWRGKRFVRDAAAPILRTGWAVFDAQTRKA